MNRTPKASEQFIIHGLILTAIWFLPTTYAFYLLLTLYLIGIPKVFTQYKERDEMIHTIETEKHKNASPWWEVLGTERHASIETCKSVRKALSKIYHPDAGSHPNDAQMQRINRAFEERIEADSYSKFN